MKQFLDQDDNGRFSLGALGFDAYRTFQNGGALAPCERVEAPRTPGGFGVSLVPAGGSAVADCG